MSGRTKAQEITALKRQLTFAQNRERHWKHEVNYLRRHLLQMRNKIDTLLKTHVHEDDE